MQGKPLEEHYDEKETEAKRCSSHHQSEQESRPHLITRVNYRIAPPTLAHPR
jgi:hypothetical protein